MDEKNKAKKILKVLNKIYPTTPIPLDHTSNFTLLMSVLLSAQCTDLNVNNVTKNIYPKYNRPEHFVKLGKKRIENLKHSKNCPVLAIKQQVWLCLKVLEFQLLQLILIYTD